MRLSLWLTAIILTAIPALAQSSGGSIVGRVSGASGGAVPEDETDSSGTRIRGYALDQQEPLTRHSLFLRADWIDAFIPHLEITGFINTDLYDGSELAQIAAEY
jgi:hypothetical protein